MVLSKDALKQIQEKLEEETRHLHSELQDMGFGADGSVEVKFDEGFADAAQTTSERAKVLGIAEGLRQRLLEAAAAMERIERGTYGKCEGCGNPIGAERLEAIPSVRLCIECKQKKH